MYILIIYHTTLHQGLSQEIPGSPMDLSPASTRLGRGLGSVASDRASAAVMLHRDPRLFFDPSALSSPRGGWLHMRKWSPHGVWQWGFRSKKITQFRENDDKTIRSGGTRVSDNSRFLWILQTQMAFLVIPFDWLKGIMMIWRRWISKIPNETRQNKRLITNFQGFRHGSHETNITTLMGKHRMTLMTSTRWHGNQPTRFM